MANLNVLDLRPILEPPLVEGDDDSSRSAARAAVWLHDWIVQYLTGVISLSSGVQLDTPNDNIMPRAALLTVLLLLATSLGGFAAARFANPTNSGPIKRATSLDAWLPTELSYALDGALNNIGADGAKARGTSSGIVVASPNKNNPDCA